EKRIQIRFFIALQLIPKSSMERAWHAEPWVNAYGNPLIDRNPSVIPPGVCDNASGVVGKPLKGAIPPSRTLSSEPMLNAASMAPPSHAAFVIWLPVASRVTHKALVEPL